MPISGGWVKLNTQREQVPLVSQRDPEHATPTPNPELTPGVRPGWANNAPAPDLPRAIMPTEHPPLVAPGGPVDMTPMDHGYGPGAAGPLTQLGAQDAAAPWHNLDQGDYAARRYVAPPMRDANPSLAVIPDMTDHGDSPSTLQYQRTGYGLPNDPEARTAARQKRWWQRPWDMHRWDVMLRPTTTDRVLAQRAHTVPDANQTTPHTPSVVGYDPRSNDRWVTPFMRRTPGAWDETAVRDGAGQPAQPLGSWGL